ncbi:MAG: transporter substrate-binding domain-containing protein [Synergistaceae bacterium]|nr:transporter substrate-binding domain-containing protein [Synergistaceae bacterium]
MKRFLTVFLVATLCSVACAEDVVKLGMLGYMGSSEESFQKGLDVFRNNISLEKLQEYPHSYPFIRSLVERRREVHFYNSLMTMLMNLRSGRVDEVILPESTGYYVMKMNSRYYGESYTSIFNLRLSFGFLEGNEKLRDEFNAALSAMREDGTLAALEAEYVHNPEHKVRSHKPERFPGADTVTVAVTGDLPPLDMFAGDGKPAGYSTAILTEIGKRLHKNMRFMNTDAGGRSNALTSGRADVLFWCQTTENEQLNKTTDEDLYALFSENQPGMIMSDPYYTWNREMILRVKTSGGFLGIFK